MVSLIAKTSGSSAAAALRASTDGSEGVVGSDGEGSPLVALYLKRFFLSVRRIG